MRHLPAGESPDDAETFQEFCTYIRHQARKVRFLITEFRDTAHFFFIELNFAEVQQVSFS